MARSVTITTPIPSLEEFGDGLGLSKARQRSLSPVFIERRPAGDYAVRKRGLSKASFVVPTQKEAVERAREISPNGVIFIERVRNSAGNGRDKWRKAS